MLMPVTRMFAFAGSTGKAEAVDVPMAVVRLGTGKSVAMGVPRVSGEMPRLG